MSLIVERRAMLSSSSVRGCEVRSLGKVGDVGADPAVLESSESFIVVEREESSVWWEQERCAAVSLEINLAERSARRSTVVQVEGWKTLLRPRYYSWKCLETAGSPYRLTKLEVPPTGTLRVGLADCCTISRHPILFKP